MAKWKPIGGAQASQAVAEQPAAVIPEMTPLAPLPPEVTTPADVAATAAAAALDPAMTLDAKRLEELTKQVANLVTEQEKLRQRVIVLEGSGGSLEIGAKNSALEPTPAVPSSAPASSTQSEVGGADKADQTTPVGEERGGAIPAIPSGPSAGKAMLRVEKGQSVDDFKQENGLDEATFTFFLEHHLPTNLREAAGNLNHESWKPYTEKKGG